MSSAICHFAVRKTRNKRPWNVATARLAFERSTLTSEGRPAEGTTVTSFTPASSLVVSTTYYWRATAIDVTNLVASPASAVLSFTAVSQPSVASALAAQEGAVLWPGVQPPGVPGQARLGSGWGVGFVTDFNGNRFLNPVLDALRVFDLLDRGMDTQSAINWMNGNGYFTVAAYYPSVQVIGFPQEYMALIAGTWDMVVRVGA